MISKNGADHFIGKLKKKYSVLKKVSLFPFAFTFFVVVQLTVFRIKLWPYVKSVGNINPPLMPSAYSKDTVSYGRRVVERAFDQSYVDVAQYCNKSSYTLLGFRDCLNGFKRMTSNTSMTYARKWPWWFQTMIRDAVDPDSELFGKWHILQFKNPKLQLCVYEKGGTKEFRDFHCHAINKSHEKSLFSCYQLQGDLMPESEKSVFLRDPLERFLSGFIDKCVVRRKIDKRCKPLVVFDDEKTGLVKNFYQNKQKLFEAYVDAMPLQWDLHFFPQSFHCGGLYTDIKNFAFVGNMGANFYQDLKRYSEQYPPLTSSLNEKFKLNAKEKEMNEGIETKAASHVLEYYTSHTVRRVLEYFSIDYLLLNLTIPQWAEHMLMNDSILA